MRPRQQGHAISTRPLIIQLRPAFCQHSVTVFAMTSIRAIAEAFIGWDGSNSQSADDLHVILNAGFVPYFI